LFSTIKDNKGNVYVNSIKIRGGTTMIKKIKKAGANTINKVKSKAKKITNTIGTARAAMKSLDIKNRVSNKPVPKPKLVETISRKPIAGVDLKSSRNIAAKPPKRKTPSNRGYSERIEKW